MGCSQSTTKSEFIENLKQSIEEDNQAKLDRILNPQQASKISLLSTRLLELNNLKLNALSYALVNCKAKAFQKLLDAGQQLTELDSNLRECHLDPMQLIIARGSIKIFKLYLPHYVNRISSTQMRENSERELYIQTAVRFSMIDIIKFIKNYFRDRTPPPDLDLKSTSGFNGENCVLYACRFGHHFLLELFYRDFGMANEFYSRNNEGLGCIELCLVGHQQRQLESFKSCLLFLIEIARVTANFNLATLKFLAKNEEIIAFLLATFEQYGMVVNNNNPERGISRATFAYSYNEEMRKFLTLEDRNSLYSQCN